MPRPLGLLSLPADGSERLLSRGKTTGYILPLVIAAVNTRDGNALGKLSLVRRLTG